MLNLNLNIFRISIFQLPSSRAVSNETSSHRARWPRSTQGICTCTLSIFYLRSYIIGGGKNSICRAQLSVSAWMPYSLTGRRSNKVKCPSDFLTRKSRHSSTPRSSLPHPSCAWQWRDKLQPEVAEEILQKVRADAWVAGRPGRAKTTDPVGGRLQLGAKYWNWKSNSL